MERVSTYLPMDRRQGLAANRALPERAEGAALFANVVPFTRLTDESVARLGARRGAEELLQLLNAVYDPLVGQIHRFGVSVVGFNPDGFACWFDDPVPGPGHGSLRATACGLALQHALQPIATVSTAREDSGPAKPLVGCPDPQLTATGWLDKK